MTEHTCCCTLTAVRKNTDPTLHSQRPVTQNLRSSVTVYRALGSGSSNTKITEKHLGLWQAHVVCFLGLK